MKKLMILAAAAVSLVVAFTGCQMTHVKTPEWEATINSHWLKRDVDKLYVQRMADGSYSVELNGYKGDASEQFPAWTREMWGGLAVIGRLAGATFNPAVASIPLTSEAANGEDVEKLVKANAEYKVQLAQVKAEVEKAKAELAAKQLDAKQTGSSGSSAEDCPDCVAK